MSIGILYESVEWSNKQLALYLNKFGIRTELINIEQDAINLSSILKHKMIVNRIFPSSPFRGYKRSYKFAMSILTIIKDSNIPIINSYGSYQYDSSKISTSCALDGKGLLVPKIYAYFQGNIDTIKYSISYPCVLKPDCGGRSKHTYILNSKKDLEKAILEIPDIPFIIQEYIHPDKNYTTRVEIVGGNIMTVLKRYIGKENLSGYHSGSKYEDYADCPKEIINASKHALQYLNIEMGSLDIVENKDNEFYIIDVNATSNFSEDNIEMLGFDPIEFMAKHIKMKYDECI
jgi:ribosomal protein S6--L-glutamate ligase